MQLLKTINPENVDEKDLSDWRHKRAARAVVFDNKNMVGLLHVKNRDYYKLPGGGIEEGEDIKIALDRECKEELGVRVKVIKEIGSIIEFRAQPKFHQTSYCFIARTNSKKNAPNFSDREKLYGYEIVWVPPDEALKLINFPEQTSDDCGRKFTKERDFCFLNEALKLIWSADNT